jgi:hypothetical protein
MYSSTATRGRLRSRSPMSDGGNGIAAGQSKQSQKTKRHGLLLLPQRYAYTTFPAPRPSRRRLHTPTKYGLKRPNTVLFTFH